MGNDSNTVGKELKDAAVGAGVGAAVGSVVPVVGTAVGAGVGAVVGSLVGLFSGGPDAQHEEANIGGRSIDARAIWDQISPGNTNSLDQGSASAKALQGVHDARSKQIDALNKTMDAAWQGGGGSAAQAGAHPLGLWLDSSANNLTKSQTYLTNQAEAFHTVKGKVQEIAKDPPSAGFMDGINPWSDKDDQINKYNEQGKANVAAFNAYYQASAQNAGGMPQYQAWQGNTLSDGGPNSNFGGSNGGNFGGSGGNFGNDGGPGSFNTPKSDLPKFDTKPPANIGPNPPHFTPPNGPVHPPVSVGPPPYNDNTSASSYVPPDLTTSGFGPTGGFGPGGGGGSFGPGSGSGSGSGAGVGGVGFGPGGSFSGASEAGAAGAAGGARAGMGSGAGGTAGRAGSPGMGGMGGARGAKGSEDGEHSSKYLVEEDPNELFGSDQLTVPPVIGE